MKKALFVVLLTCGLASGQPAVQQATSAKPKAEKHQPGSENTPIFIKKITTKEEKDAGDKEEAERKKKSEMDVETLNVAKEAKDAAKAATNYAGLGLLLSLVLTGIAFVQYRMFSKQLDIMKDSNATAAAAAQSAQASVAVAEDAGRTNHAAFIAANRPKLIIRNIDAVPRATGVNAGLAIQVEYEIVNLGNTTATITEISHRLWKPKNPERLPAKPPYQAVVYPKLVVPPGYSGYQLKVEGEEAENFFFHQAFAEEGDKIGDTFLKYADYFLLGYIEYTDQAGRVRRTGFLRRLDLATGRFTAMDFPDYEYQD
ncbi:MAG: hypothetical protein ACK5RJ_12235 [Burkholderiales bacterium]|jgi:hypothetical protein|nr:hypothetical protein [Rhodocyclaceae bacterium]MCA3023488.1 hypothetical protein [Rhodocyclaceae bacterium]MCA3056408.1 hypothetical protein [Rhodocyclaceae bacterium]